MCLNFSASDLEEIKLNISNLTIPSKRTDDPILGPLSDQQQLSSVFPKKHGLLIQKTLLKIIKASPGWDGVNEFKFERNNKRKDHLIDTFAFNKNLGVALFIEVKRRLGQQQASSIEKILSYNRTVADKKSEIVKEVELDPKNSIVQFLVFNAYGEEKDKNKLPTIPVITPPELDNLFSNCVSAGWYDLEKQVYQHLDESGLSVTNSIREKYMDNEFLDRLHSEQIENPTCQQPPLDSIKKFLQHKQTNND